MAALHLATTVTGVNSQGEQVKARRTAIGMSVAALAKRAGVDRGSLAALEEGRAVRDTTAAAIEMTLRDIEQELGMDVPSQVAAPSGEPQMIEYEVSGDFGVRVVVKGPVESATELEASVARLIRDMRSDAS